VPYGGGLVGIVLLALWIYCIIDVISADETLVRNLPKIVWLLLVIILPVVGSVVWLVVGRPERASFRPGTTTYRRPLKAITAPDDDPRFLAQLDDEAKRLRRWEEDLKRREDEMRRRDEGDQGTT
jgi:hypothetical protein